MKKTILLILAVLPIVLLVIIAFAGQILSLYQHISVERVEFIDRYGNTYTDEHVFTVEQGKTKETSVKIYPELASNKRVSYTSSDESICTVDEDGVITGVHYGFTTITVKTDDGSKIAILNVRVKADVPFSVTLNKHELSMFVDEVFVLGHVVDAPVAVNKKVVYESSDPGVVSVDAAGKLTAISDGTAIIKVTTVSGGLIDECTVTVNKIEPDRKPDLYFNFENVDGVVKNKDGVYVLPSSTLNLAELLEVNNGVIIDDVVIDIELKQGNATFENGVITFDGFGFAVVTAYVGEKDNPTSFTEVKLGYIPKS